MVIVFYSCVGSKWYQLRDKSSYIFMESLHKNQKKWKFYMTNSEYISFILKTGYVVNKDS